MAPLYMETYGPPSKAIQSLKKQQPTLGLQKWGVDVSRVPTFCFSIRLYIEQDNSNLCANHQHLIINSILVSRADGILPLQRKYLFDSCNFYDTLTNLTTS